MPERQAEDHARPDGQGSHAGADAVAFSRDVLEKPLRPYQETIVRAIADSVRGGVGATFTVMLARQMGKNELSAHLEAWLLTQHAAGGGTIVKAAPTYRPQVINSMRRLESLLRAPKLVEQWGRAKREHGYLVGLGDARVAFFSAEPSANVMGATASLLLEIDEAQDVDAEKYTRDFRPMASSTNATTVLYGTAWTQDTLLEQQKQTNLRLEAHDHFRRHFEYDWTHGAAANPSYDTFVRAEIERLGREHPLIRTQYLLQPLQEAGTFFTAEQRALLRGTHGRERLPSALPEDDYYVAAVDVAGAAEEATDGVLRRLEPRKDSTVAGIARVTPLSDGHGALTRIVDLYWWTGRPLHEQCDQLIGLLRDHWGCRRVTIDASGLGADLAARLERALGTHAVEPVVFSVPTKSKLAYNLLARVNSGRLQMWSESTHGSTSVAESVAQTPREDRIPSGPSDAYHLAVSPEATEFWREVERARPIIRSGEQLSFYVPEHLGHDDFVTMLALLAWAVRDVRTAPYRVVLPPPEPMYAPY
jgi:hypothetical protein